MLILSELNSFFDSAFQDLPCEDNTRAYIVSIFTKYQTAHYDLSKESITLSFIEAKKSRDFLMLQTVGDWLFFINSLYPESLRHASKNYYYDIARLSYYSCYQIINRSWRSYELLADDFIPLSEYIHQSFHQMIAANLIVLPE